MDNVHFAKRPLVLANLYKNGLGTLWESYPQAAKFLSKNESRVTKEQIRDAVALASFPPVVLDLFAGITLNSTAVKKLLTARRKFGSDSLAQMAAGLTPAKDSKQRRDLLALLNKETPKSQWTGAFPASVVRVYEDGLRSGRWSNPHQACREMTISHQLYKAIEIMRLPTAILELFCIETLSFSIGRELVSLVAILGQEQLLARSALWKNNLGTPLSDREKLAVLSAKDPRKDIQVSMRRLKAKVVVEFHCADPTGNLASKIADLTSIVEMSVAMFVRKSRDKPMHGIPNRPNG